MRRIELSQEEKKVLRELKRGNGNIPTGMDNFDYIEAIIGLSEIGLIKSVVNYDEIIDVALLPKGHAYINSNPALHNPINWTMIAAIGACIAALSSITALFLACSAR